MKEEKPTYEEALKAKETLLAYLTSPEYEDNDTLLRSTQSNLLWFALHNYDL